MKIAIIGAGVSGLAAATYLIRNNIDVDIYSKDLGGEYLSGGLKYIHSTDSVNRFFDKILKLNYSIEKVVGSILLGSDVELYPEFFHKNPLDGFHIQKSYWIKTRGTEDGFNVNCMNEPWMSNKIDLKVIPDGGISRMVDHMKFLVEDNANIIKKKLTDEDISIIIHEYDFVIYTIPISHMVKLSAMEGALDESSKKLHIGIVDVPRSIMRKIWFDYMYIPSGNYATHRISKSFDNKLHFETNGENYFEGWLTEDLKQLHELLNLGNPDYKELTIPIKGQILKSANEEVQDKLDENFPNVIRLGRYAEWDRRITFDDVIKSVLTRISKIIGE